MPCFWILLLFSCSVMSDSLRPHGLQHAGLPCPSPSPGACSNSLPLSRWCHPTISSSVVPFSSCIQSFPTSGSFPMSQLFASGDQSIGALVSASVLPVNIQGWFPLGLTALMGFWSFITQICPGPPLLSFKKNRRLESKPILRTCKKSRIHSRGGSKLTMTPPHRQGLQEREQGRMCVQTCIIQTHRMCNTEWSLMSTMDSGWWRYVNAALSVVPDTPFSWDGESRGGWQARRLWGRAVGL